MLRAAVYCRVSTADQADQGFSLPAQLEACGRYAAANDLEVVAELAEDCSGKTPMSERREGQHLAAMVARREIGAVVVHHVDRLSRDIVDLLMTVRDWLRAGVEVHAGDVGRIESELDITLIIKGWQGGEEWAKIRKRSMDGKRAKARAGFVIGGREPYGYRHTRDEKGKIVNFEIVESEAETVRLIYRLYLEGDGDGEPMAAVATARRLSELRIPTPGEVRPGSRRTRAPGMWQPDRVIKILSKELYAGVWRFGVRIGKTRNERPESEQITVEVPAIVSRSTWEAVQERMRHNRRMARRNRKRDYLLSGLIQCGCGFSMCGNFRSNHRYYTCAARHNRHAGLEELACHARSVRGEAVEADIWESLVAIFEDLQRLEELLQLAQQEELEAAEPKRSELATVEANLDEVERQAAKMAGNIFEVSGVVGRELEQKIEAVNLRHEALARRRDELRATLAVTRVTQEAIDDTLRFAADVRLGLLDADYTTRRRVLEKLQVMVTVRDGRFYVESLIGQWDGEIRKLPRAGSNGAGDGGIVTASRWR